MNSSDGRSPRTYTGWEVLMHNLPYLFMIGLGTAMIWRWPGTWWALAYLAYGILGALWIIWFVCPYCRFWGTRACPCGYGVIAARLRSKARCEAFEQRFRRHIPVIVPLWFLPLVSALSLAWRGLDWPMIILACCFCVDAFVILPLLSARCGCRDCQQRQSCPWMGHIRAARDVVVESSCPSR